jgi:NADH:ubiquinone oxidoreductase subunit 2 (subunit N)
LLNFDFFFFNNITFEAGISVLFFNIAAYIFNLGTIFIFFFLFNLRLFKTLNDFKLLGSLNYFTGFLVLLLLSMAGMPPLMGFVSKFLIFIFLLLKHQYLIFLIFSVLSIFSIYFYIQNVRFAISKTVNNVFIIKQNYILLQFKSVYYSVVLNFFNLFGVFFFNDFLIIINFVFSFICLG